MAIQFKQKNITGLILQLSFLVLAAVVFHYLKDYSMNNQNERTWSIVKIVANSIIVAIFFYGFILYEIVSTLITYLRSPNFITLTFDDDLLSLDNEKYKISELTCLVEGSWLILGPGKFRYAICILKGKKRIFTSRPYFNVHPKQEVTEKLRKPNWFSYQEE